MMAARHGQLRAYTLLELVLVLAILAITVAAAAPVLSNFARGRRVEEAARQFVALTHWARSQAINDGVTFQILIDTSAGSWRVNVQDGEMSGVGSDATFVQASGPFGRVYTAPEGVEIQSELPVINGQRAITFDPTGRCDTGSVRFVGNGSQVTVSCDAPIETFRILKDNGGRS
jgi:prepilin-type N-terminal cleavage/methylation domain-containing protein